MALHHDAPGEVLRLAPVDTPETQTTALAKTLSFETVHLIVRAGNVIPVHKVDGPMTLYCIKGHVALEGGCPLDMRAGGWIYLKPGAPHSVRAMADSVLLLTILFDQAISHATKAEGR